MINKKYISITLVFLLIMFSNFAHSQKNKYWVKFRDKANNEYSVDRPEEFLSSRSLERRSKQNINIVESDLPVTQLYIDSLLNLGVEVLYTSKWFNSAVIKSTDSLLIDSLESFEFIVEKQKVYGTPVMKSAISKFQFSPYETTHATISDYGFAREQIYLCNGQFLHDLGFCGQGLVIAVIDAGFYHVNLLPAFDSLWMNSRILGTRNFVDDDYEIYEAHPHGMYVLSIIGGNIPQQLVGTAPKASYWLLRSEDTSSEFLVEEDNWIAAAEFADSVGADIINSSLGYYVFDDPEMNHTYADMDGKTTRVSRGATMAASKGMLVVVSAGNEGNKPWHYLIAPSDAENVLGIGAVDSLNRKAIFSSFGPSADGRIKPDITAMGVANAFQGITGEINRGNGTSFSSPVIAGLAACLWQSFPEQNSLTISKAIISSALNFSAPNTSIGHGTPDFALAYNYLKVMNSYDQKGSASVYPNPFTDHLTIILQKEPNDDVAIEFFNSFGQLIKKESYDSMGSSVFITTLNNLTQLSSGNYILRITSGNNISNNRIIKI